MNSVSVSNNNTTAGDIVLVCVPLQFCEEELPSFDVGPVVENPDEGSGDLAESTVDGDASETLCVDGPGDGLAWFPGQSQRD